HEAYVVVPAATLKDCWNPWRRFNGDRRRGLGVASRDRVMLVSPEADERGVVMSKHALRNTCVLLASLIAVLFVISCSTVALTGRKQINLVPDSEMLSTSTQQYDQFMKENKVSTDAAATERVKRVGAKIQAAVEEYARQNNRTKDLQGYAWEF